MITVTTKDILRNKQVTPGFQYVGLCSNHYTKLSEKGNTLHMYEIEIVESPNGEFNGVPISDFMVVESAISMSLKFYAACGLPIDYNHPENISFNEKDPVGKKFKMNIANELYNGRMMNRATDFLPISSAA